LLALLGVHHFLHVSRIRVKSNKLKEARCILCGKNERFLKATVGKSKGKNKSQLNQPKRCSNSSSLLLVV
jgi:hypothetical protein